MSQILIENNNSLDKFNQVWPQYVFTEKIESTPPDLSLGKKEVLSNKDGTPVIKYSFFRLTDNGEVPHLVFLQNLELTKEYRQSKVWKLEFEEDGEEYLRKIILPGVTSNREYQISFSNGDLEIPFNFVNPDVDFETCQIKTSQDFEKLYISGWFYNDITLADKASDLPFSSTPWLLKDSNTGNKIRFEIKKEKIYVLPSDDLELEDDKDIIVTTNILNQVLNSLVDLDEGEYW